MVRFFYAVWLVQAAGFLVIGGRLVFRPESAQAYFDRLESQIELGLIAFVAPLALGMGVVTLQLLRPSFAWLRESLASVFVAAWALAFVVALWFGAGPWALSVTAFFALCNLTYVIRFNPLPTPVSARPSASDEAPLLGRVWGIQTAYYTVFGVVAMLFPEWVVERLFDVAACYTYDREADILHVAAPLYLGMALLSHHAIGAQTDETWRGYCRAFLTAQAACTGAMILALTQAGSAPSGWSYSVIVPNAALAWVNAATLFDRRWIRRAISALWGSLDLWWLAQLGFLLAVVVATWIDAKAMLDFGVELLDAGRGQAALAEDLLRLIGPLALGLAALTLLGLLRRDRRSRYDLARIFVILGGAMLAARLLNDPIVVPETSFFYRRVAPILLVVSAIVALVNLLIVAFPDWQTADEQYRGAADTKPRWVYRSCVAQAVLFGAVALLLGLAPSWLARVVLVEQTDQVAPLLVSALRAAAPFWAAMAATSGLVAATSDEQSWRGLCRWFGFWQAAYVVTFVYVFDSNLYEHRAMLWAAVVTAFAMINVSAAQIPLRISDLAAQPRPSGWLTTDLGPGLPLLAAVLRRRARPYHRVGVGAAGTFLPALADDVPRNAFFDRRDQPMLCTVRFSNARADDDAALDVRGCALRLAWPDGEQALNVVMATGAYGPVATVFDAMLLRWAPASMRRGWLQRSYVAREAYIAGQRRAPASFAELCFHTQLVRLWIGLSERGETVGRRCRMRLVPASGAPESGLPTPSDEAAPWLTARSEVESRPRDYLRQELAARLARGTVELRLEAQLGPAPHTDRSAYDDASIWYDATVDWDEVDFPWLSVGTVVLDHVLPDAATEHLRFDPSQGAGVIATPRSASWRDERSLAAAQDRVMRLAGRLRATLYSVFGRTPKVDGGAVGPLERP